MLNRKITATLLAAVSLGAAGSLSGPVASAEAGPVWLTTQDLFHFPAWSPDSQRCIERTERNGKKGIRLAEGVYSLGPFVVHASHPDSDDRAIREDIPLGSGRYQWSVCRWWSAKFQQYQFSTTLRRGSRTISKRNELSGDHNFGDGVYKWGGRLEFTGQLGLTHPSHR